MRSLAIQMTTKAHLTPYKFCPEKLYLLSFWAQKTHIKSKLSNMIFIRPLPPLKKFVLCVYDGNRFGLILKYRICILV